MAAVLKLMRGPYGGMGSYELNLLASGAPGIQLLGGWQPKIATPTMWPPQAVTETLRVPASASDTDALAEVLQGLHKFQRFVAQYWADRDEHTPVWLWARLPNEAQPRRCLVRKLEAQFDFGWFEAEAVANQLELTLVIEREPYWEGTAVTGLDVTGGISLLGGSGEVSEVFGDAPARLAAMILAPNVAVAGTYAQFWIGFRSYERHDPLADFVAIWELEAATNGMDTSAMSSGFQSGGAGKRCTFATAEGWAERCTFTLQDVAPYPAHLTRASRGTFLVLLRANAEADTPIDVQLRAGHSDYITHYSDITRVQIATNGLFSLGLLTLPLRDMHALGDELVTTEQYQEFQIWARRVSGAGSLDLDCLLLIPADELMVYLDHVVIRDNSGIPNQTIVSAAPEGQLVALSQDYNSGDGLWYNVAAGDVSVNGSGLGLGAGRFYIAGALADGTNKVADTVDVTVQRWHRYLSLRGAGV